MARRTRRLPLAPVSRRLSGLALAGAAVVASTLAAVPLHAAELGEPRVSSHIGQPLVADIELTMLEDPAAPVQVRLASREVYNGAGIAVPPALSTLNLSVMRRDGRQFLHATTLRAVEGEHLHLYLELVDKGQRVVRLATLWLTPDPNPAPPPRPPAPAPVAPSVPAPVVAALSTPLPAPLPAPVPVPAAPPPARPAAPSPAAAPVRAEPKRVRLPNPVPKLALPGAQAEAHAPSCQRQSEDARACTALGEKNADLRAQLARLEDKVKGLQAALGARQGEPAPAAPAAPSAAKPAAAHAPSVAPQPPGAHAPTPPQASAAGAVPAGDDKAQAAPDPAHESKGDGAHAGDAEPTPEAAPPKPEVKPAGPKPIHAIKPLVPRKPNDKEKDKEKEADGEGGLPWGWIGAALALLGLGAGGVAFLRRRKPGNVDIPAPGLLARLRQRLAARGRPAPAAPAQAAREAEPTLE